MKSTELLYRKIGHLLYHSWQCDFNFFFFPPVLTGSYRLGKKPQWKCDCWCVHRLMKAVLLLAAIIILRSLLPLFLKHSRDKPRNNKKHEMWDAEVFMYKPEVGYF